MKCCSDVPSTLQCLDCPMTYRKACRYCNRIFYDKTEYKHHLKVIHPRRSENTDGAKAYFFGGWNQ